MVVIKELDEKEFQDYVGTAEIPKESLLEQINKAQGERRRKIALERSEKPVSSNAGFDLEDLSPSERFMFGVLDLLQYLIPLVFVHAGLNILVRKQYGQETPFTEVASEAMITIPVMSMIHLLGHPNNDKRWFRIMAFFFSVSIGMYLIYTSFEESYYMIMARAPPLGTIWIWLLLEMDWDWCAGVLVVLAAFMYKKGYHF